MCVIPSRDTFAMLSADQIPPPTAIRSVTHVISIPILRNARCLTFPGVFREHPLNREPFSSSFSLRDPTRGEIDNPHVSVELQLPGFILRYPLDPYALALSILRSPPAPVRRLRRALPPELFPQSSASLSRPRPSCRSSTAPEPAPRHK
jgi:hypothetical protein